MHVCMFMKHLTAEMFGVCCPGFVDAEVAALLMRVGACIRYVVHKCVILGPGGQKPAGLWSSWRCGADSRRRAQSCQGRFAV
jgi:hypothetical protein